MSLRVMVWGTGRLGSLCIREILARGAFQLVGVRTYSLRKHGLDVGEFVGSALSGVKMTARAEDLISQDCDCVLYMARDWGDFVTLPDLIYLLEQGKNVVTPLPYHHAQLALSQEMVAEIERACRVGKSTFYATGVNPDVISSRLLHSLTGMCIDVESITLREVWRCGCIAPQELRGYGFGLAIRDAAGLNTVYKDSIHFLRSICLAAAADFGLKVGTLRSSVELLICSKDTTAGGGYDIPAGSVAGVVHRLVGFELGEMDRAWVTAETNWIATDDLTVDGITTEEHWVISIKGNPALRMGLGLEPREPGTAGRLKYGDDYVATLAACLQAIPAVVKASPGILESTAPLVHWHSCLGRSLKT